VREALQRRASAPRVLRPEGRAAGRRDPPRRPRPEPRRRHPRRRDGARHRWARILVAQHEAFDGGTRAGSRPSARTGRGSRCVHARRGRSPHRPRHLQRRRPRLRRGRRARRHDPARRGSHRGQRSPDRQRPPERIALMTDKPPRYASWTTGKLPLPELLELKGRGDKIVMVTAYDAPSGRLADAAGVDLVLVGDSSGMVVHGRESTVPVSLDEIVFMTQWVTRGAKRPIVVADMPFGSYEA